MSISSKKEFYEEDCIMNYNYENIRMIMEGAELLYSMLCELNKGIGNLPGCKVTAGLKALSANIGAAGAGVYQTMRNIASDEKPCDECEDDTEDYEDIPDSADLQELLDLIGGIITSGKPVSISADIYINEDKEPGSED